MASSIIEKSLESYTSNYNVLLNITTTGRNYDVTHDLSASISDFRGLLFLVMHPTSYRVLGATFVPRPVFSGGGAYVQGVANLSGTDTYTVVFVYKTATSIEVAHNLASTTVADHLVCRVFGIR